MTIQFLRLLNEHMIRRQILLVLSGLTLSTSVLAQTVGGPQPPASGPERSQQPVAEPWMARSVPLSAAPVAEPPLRTADKGAALERIDLPPAIEQGVDMIYVDQDLAQFASAPDGDEASASGWAPLDLFASVNPIYTGLRQGLIKYQQTWGRLPDIKIADGAPLKPGATGERVAALRQRLGLAASGSYDNALAAKVKHFQSDHALPADGIAGSGTIEALNRGAKYYEQLILLNMERAKRLPAPDQQAKYAVVDAGGARLSLWEGGRKIDEMKVVVGKAETATPMLAAYIRYVSVNPYWNVPPELVKSLIAPRVVAQGISYLTDREYQVLSSYGDDATVVDPASVDWAAVVDGRSDVRLRRLPSPANSMRNMKFMLPNYFGIYLHDTPQREHFAKDELWISNGCVRVEDYKRLAAWLFDGAVPKGRDPKVEEEVDLPKPIPVYMTYLTAAPTADDVQFLPDRYGRDASVLERYGPQLLDAVSSI